MAENDEAKKKAEEEAKAKAAAEKAEADTKAKTEMPVTPDSKVVKADNGTVTRVFA